MRTLQAVPLTTIRHIDDIKPKLKYLTGSLALSSHQRPPIITSSPPPWCRSTTLSLPEKHPIQSSMSRVKYLTPCVTYPLSDSKFSSTLTGRLTSPTDTDHGTPTASHRHLPGRGRQTCTGSHHKPRPVCVACVPHGPGVPILTITTEPSAMLAGGLCWPDDFHITVLRMICTADSGRSQSCINQTILRGGNSNRTKLTDPC